MPVDKRTLVTAVLCAAAALGASAVMTKVVPVPEGAPAVRAKAAGGPSGAPGSAGPSAGPPRTREARPQLSSSPGSPVPTSAPPAPGGPVPGGPAAFTGALFTGGLEGGHFCTATVVRSPGRDLVVTAGHCLLAGDQGEGGAVFVPGYANGTAPYGTWKLEEVFEDPRWAESTDDAYDLAFARLAPDASGRRIEDVTGGAVLDTGGRAGEEVTVTGYPADRKVPRTCTAVAVRQGPGEQRFDCADFPAGTSGSAWIARDGKIIGVLTGGDTDDVSTSPVLGPWAAELYSRATAGGRR
ncbi:trypsin-like serine peptidase [Streptomyces sp. NPDC051567]|uniref:trypsin-like serine peptidase n=1 Tax=Streptomyces sp. NPDC051567 TaxID=3365660 RepID=UPI0037B31A5F